MPQLSTSARVVLDCCLCCLQAKGDLAEEAGFCLTKVQRGKKRREEAEGSVGLRSGKAGERNMNSKKVGLLRLVLRWAVDFWTVVSLLV